MTPAFTSRLKGISGYGTRQFRGDEGAKVSSYRSQPFKQSMKPTALRGDNFNVFATTR